MLAESAVVTAAKPSIPDARPGPIPVGPRLESVLELAYRARRPVLIEGPTGIGKSDIVRKVAGKLGIAHVVLDLSLLEPPDLVGLPVIKDGRTSYAVPDILPQDGAGILMLEELNRAERYIQQPALQLLSARRLHGYELPPGWACFAAVNPEGEGYHVTPLDRALRARFLSIAARADRASWLAWAQVSDVHPAIIGLAQAHERVLDDVPPRTWTYASHILKALRPEEINNGALLRDALSGYLPPSWVELVVAGRDAWTSHLPFDVRALLSDYDRRPDLAREVRSYAEAGKTDRLDELTTRLCRLLEGPEAGVLVAERQITLAAFEALVADLPGDQREKLQESLGRNPTATALVDVRPEEVVQNYPGSAAERKILSWRADPLKHHRLALVVTGLSAHLERQAKLAEVKRSNVVRTCLGHLLAELPEKWALDLVATLKRLGITPIRPT
ncbi:MoxR family ATPase [Polyangium aurulentum]|nr:MoxR family ATPase [Polyangium aurulentum]